MKIKAFNNKKKSESGITLDKELKIKSILNDNLPIYVRVIQIILIIMAVICPIFSFLQGFKFKLNYTMIVLVLCICVVIEYIAFRILKIYEQALPAMLVVLSYSVVLVVMFKRISSGFLKVVEEYITYFNFHYNTDYVLNIKVGKEALNNASWLVLILSLFVSLVISYIILVESNKITYLIITALWPILCFAVGAKPNFIFFILYIIVSIVIFGMDSISKNYEISDEIHGVSKRQKMFKDLAMVRIGITIGIFTLCLFVIFYALLSKKRYDNSSVIKNISDNLRSTLQGITSTNDEQVDAFDREETGQSSIVLTDMIIKKPVINNGVLSGTGSVRFYNKNVFRIVSNEITETMYLKEYVGSKYDNGWICDGEGDNKKLSQLDNMLRDTLMQNIGKNVKQEIPYSVISIVNKESDIKGELVPTGSNISYAMTKNGLVKYTEKNKNVVAGYEFEFATLYNLMDKISYNKNNYNKNIVIENYKEVPEELKEAIKTIKPEIDKYIEKLNSMKDVTQYARNKDKFNIIRALVEYFNLNYTYTLNPGKPVDEVDPIEFFLLQNKKGYCMYYAAAATAILRYYGIPARYVEGYVVRAKDCEGAKRAEADKYLSKLKDYDKAYYGFENAPLYEYNVKDNNGHAWVEAYIDGIGWVPVEVTSSQLSESRGHSELEEALKEEDEEVPSSTNEPITTMAPTQASEEPVVQTMKPKQTPISEPKEENEKEDNNNDIVLFIVILVTLLIVIVGILCIKKEKASSDVEKNIKLYDTDKMEYVNKMMSLIFSRFDIVFNSNMTYEEFAKIIVEKFPEYSFEKIDTIIRFILKDSYSEKGIVDAERKQIIDFYNYLVDKYDELLDKQDKTKGKKNKKREKYIRKV